VDPYLVGEHSTTTHRLDPETGALDPLVLPGGAILFQSSYLPHSEDAQGRSEMGGVWLDPLTGEYSLTRVRLPSGEVLGRVALTSIPAGPLCWDPESPSQALFAGADGKLYCTSVESDYQPTPVRAQLPIQWSGDVPLPSGIFVQDACWPADPRLAGRVLVSVRLRRKVGDRLDLAPARLWYLRLDHDRTMVVEAAPVEPARLNATASRQDWQERYPSLASTVDGQLVLAFQIYRRGRSTGELRIAPIRIDRQSGAVSASTSSAESLLEGCVRMAPTFSRNGERVSCLVRTQGGPARVGTVDIAPLLASTAARLTRAFETR
jgi:hypothetical protein